MYAFEKIYDKDCILLGPRLTAAVLTASRVSPHSLPCQQYYCLCKPDMVPGYLWAREAKSEEGRGHISTF